MAEPNHADEAAEDFRRDIAPLRDDLVAQPSDFGMAYLSVDELIARAESRTVATESPTKSERPRWHWAVAGLAAAAVTALILAPQVNREDPNVNATPTHSVKVAPSQTSSATYSSSSEVLLAAATAPSPATRTAPYWHVRSIQAFGSEQVPREVWIGRGRPSVLRQDGIVEEIPAYTFPVGHESLVWRQLQTLPTDVRSLRSLLSRDDAPKGRDKRWVVFKSAGELVAEAPVPPGVREALWRVLAAEAGTSRTERASDSIGRSGWSVSLSVPGEGRVTYLVDPSSGQLLEARHFPAGQSSWSVTYLERGPADSAPQLTGA